MQVIAGSIVNSKNVRLDLDGVVKGNHARHVVPEDFSLSSMRLRLGLSIKAVRGALPDEFVRDVTGADLRPSELDPKRQATLWIKTTDGVTSPVVRDFHGPARRVRSLLDELGTVHAALLVKADVPYALDFGTVGEEYGWSCTQRADGTIRIAGSVTSYYGDGGVQHMLITAQALAAIAHKTGGMATHEEIARALQGKGGMGNYRPQRAHLTPASYRY